MRDMEKKQAYDEAVKLLKVVGTPDPEIRMSSYPHPVVRRYVSESDDSNCAGL